MLRTRNKKNNPSIYKKNAELVEKVLKEGADPNFIKEKSNEDRLPALSNAVVKNLPSVIEIFKALLSDKRTDVNIVDKFGVTPLIYACEDIVSEEIGVQLISLLLKNPKIEINKGDELLGTTALHKACIKGRSKCVKALIEDIRIDINITNSYDWTPLFTAVSFGHLEVVKVLLTSSSIDPNKLISDSTPLHLANKKGYKDIMRELLKDKRTKTDIPDRDGRKADELPTILEIIDEIIGPKIYEDIYCI